MTNARLFSVEFDIKLYWLLTHGFKVAIKMWLKVAK